eukprot:9791459-Alexandrium_andersonii.AAC.2
MGRDLILLEVRRNAKLLKSWSPQQQREASLDHRVRDDTVAPKYAHRGGALPLGDERLLVAETERLVLRRKRNTHPEAPQALGAQLQPLVAADIPLAPRAQDGLALCRRHEHRPRVSSRTGPAGRVQKWLAGKVSTAVALVLTAILAHQDEVRLSPTTRSTITGSMLWVHSISLPLSGLSAGHAASAGLALSPELTGEAEDLIISRSPAQPELHICSRAHDRPELS